jgi:hypothetical protein
MRPSNITVRTILKLILASQIGALALFFTASQFLVHSTPEFSGPTVAYFLNGLGAILVVYSFAMLLASAFSRQYEASVRLSVHELDSSKTVRSGENEDVAFRS